MSTDAFDEVQRQAVTRIGSTLKGKWRLDQLLGVGGMAAVYAATHRNQKRVAVKVLHPELSFNAAVRQRFLREGYVANTVQHAGAVSVDDDDLGEDGCAFLVMELLDGETLEARWERKGRRLPTPEVLAFMDRVLDTLTAAHARGVVHRDLKPENLFFTRDAQIKVLDFGIARVRELSGSTKTQTGSLMGTPAFMSPEQARGRWDEVDAQSDLWAVGATIFTLLTGELVHVAQTTNEAIVMAVTQPARSLGALRPDLSEAVVRFVDRSLAYDKAARWPDAQPMQNALRETYATLEGEWDEQTVLHQAAASLPDGPLSIPNGATSGTTALGTSTSAHPPAAPLNKRTLLLGAAGVVGLLVVVGIEGAIAGGHKAAAPTIEPSHAAAMPIAETKSAVPVAAASDAPAPPLLRIEDLPAAEPGRQRATAQPSTRIGGESASRGESDRDRVAASRGSAEPPKTGVDESTYGGSVRRKRMNLVSEKVVAVVLLLIGTLCAAPSAHAQSTTAAAVALFDEGRAALERGDFDVACTKFKESNRIAAALGTAFNLANCEEKRGRLATAWVLFKQVATQMNPDDPRLSVATEHVVALEKRAPRVIFSANERTPPDTRVRLDDLELASASFGSAIPLDPGQHHAVIRSSSTPSRTLTFIVAEGETTTLELTAPPTPPHPAAPRSAPPTADAPAIDDRVLGLERPTATLLAGGIGAAGLALGIITGIIGLHAQSVGDGECSAVTRSCTRRGHDANQDAKAMAVVSSTGFVVAILGAGAAGYLYFTAPTTPAQRLATVVGLGGNW